LTAAPAFAAPENQVGDKAEGFAKRGPQSPLANAFQQFYDPCLHTFVAEHGAVYVDRAGRDVRAIGAVLIPDVFSEFADNLRNEFGRERPPQT